jgi:hypothetical protein
VNNAKQPLLFPLPAKQKPANGAARGPGERRTGDHTIWITLYDGSRIAVPRKALKRK